MDATFRRLEPLTSAHAPELHALYQAEWWTTGRSLADVRRMLEQSRYNIGAMDESSGALAGFARVLTDGVFKALIFDIIVAAPFRGRGLGEQLMEWILTHPDLERVRHFELYCRDDMFAFYRKFGFSTDVGPITLMRRLGNEQE